MPESTMGRRPIGQRAMTSAERQRRFLARIREQAHQQMTVKPVPAPAEKTIRLQHLAMDPVRVAQWIHRELGPDATRAIRNAFDAALQASR
jgi:hypothetical protein